MGRTTVRVIKWTNSFHLSKKAGFPSIQLGWWMSTGQFLVLTITSLFLSQPTVISKKSIINNVSEDLSCSVHKEPLPQHKAWSPNWSMTCPQIHLSVIGCGRKMGKPMQPDPYRNGKFMFWQSQLGQAFHLKLPWVRLQHESRKWCLVGTISETSDCFQWW